MKLGKRVGSLLLALALMVTLVVVPSFESKAYTEYPKNLVQTSASGNNVSFKWDAVAGATSYSITITIGTTSGQIVKTDSTTATSYTFAAPYRGFRYYALVTAVGADGTTSATAYLSIYSAPMTPGNIFVYSWKPKTNKPYLEWAGYSSDTYSYVPSGYEVKVTTLAGKKIKTYKTTSKYLNKAISKIKNAGFKVQIRSYANITNSAGNITIWSDWSKAKAFVPQPQPKSRHYIGSSTSTVTWNKIKNAKSYTIYKVTGSYGNYKFKKYKKVGAGTTSITVPRSLGSVTIVPEVKVKGKKYKWNKKDFGYFYGVSV